MPPPTGTGASPDERSVPNARAKGEQSSPPLATSAHRTRFPAAAAKRARVATIVVLPTPPLPVTSTARRARTSAQSNDIGREWTLARFGSQWTNAAPSAPVSSGMGRHLSSSIAATLSLGLALGCSAGPEPGNAFEDAGPPADAGPGADDEVALPEDEVVRLDLEILPSDFARMQDDMADMLGPFGAGGDAGPGGAGAGPGGGPGAPPAEALDACSDLAEQDACTVVLADAPVAGQCVRIPDGRLACAPDGGPSAGPLVTDLIPRTPIWVPCTVRRGGHVWAWVGMRFKGNSSLRDPWLAGVGKLPLRLKFDAFEDEHPETLDQRYSGLKSLSLSNGSRDPGLLRTKVGNELFLRAGLPAQRTALVRLFVDHGAGPVYFGVYVASELPSDDAFLDRAFGAHDGNLYKPDGTAGTLATWDEAGLGKQNHEEEADFSDVRALFEALRADRSDPAAFRAGLEARFEPVGFLRWLALNTAIQDWDTYGIGPHNFYLYADPGDDGRFTWIPWDHSESLRADPRALSLGLDDVGEGWPLIRALLDDPTYRQIYEDSLAAAIEGPFEPNATEALLREAHEQIAPFMVGPDGEQPGFSFLQSDEELDADLEEIIAHIHERAAVVAAHVDGSR